MGILFCEAGNAEGEVNCSGIRCTVLPCTIGATDYRELHIQMLVQMKKGHVSLELKGEVSMVC